MRIAAVTFAVLALGVVAAQAARLGTARTYSETKMFNCLNHHIVSAPRDTHWHTDRYSPPGMTGVIHMLYLTGPRFDDSGLYFFKTPALAHAGEAKLVSVWIYGRGLPAVLKALNQFRIPPTKAAADSLHEVLGNIVVIWQYPRHYRVRSEKVIAACLAASTT
jgi:hypothetical protein